MLGYIRHRRFWLGWMLVVFAQIDIYSGVVRLGGLVGGTVVLPEVTRPDEVSYCGC